jgi:hypothetical protein
LGEGEIRPSQIPKFAGLRWQCSGRMSASWWAGIVVGTRNRRVPGRGHRPTPASGERAPPARRAARDRMRGRDACSQRLAKVHVRRAGRGKCKVVLDGRGGRLVGTVVDAGVRGEGEVIAMCSVRWSGPRTVAGLGRGFRHPPIESCQGDGNLGGTSLSAIAWRGGRSAERGSSGGGTTIGLELSTCAPVKGLPWALRAGCE